MEHERSLAEIIQEIWKQGQRKKEPTTVTFNREQVSQERVELDRVYRFHCPTKVSRRGVQGVEELIGTRYRVLGFPEHGLTGQDLVLYQGLDSGNMGKLFVCSISNFLVHFEPIATVIEPAGPPTNQPTNLPAPFVVPRIVVEGVPDGVFEIQNREINIGEGSGY